jgi:hypothetical protein
MSTLRYNREEHRYYKERYNLKHKIHNLRYREVVICMIFLVLLKRVDGLILHLDIR